jgi:hypothetical protein
VQGDLIYGSAADTFSALAKNTNASRYLSNSGTSNNPAWAQVDLTNGVTGNLPVGNLNSGTGATANTLWHGNATWSAVNLSSADVTGITPIANGGTNANLTLANGGVIYSTASAFGVSAAGTSGQILRSAGASTPTWSTATYPATSGTADNVMTSDGTNWVSTAPGSVSTVTVRSAEATGGLGASAAQGTTLTIGVYGLFNVPAKITVNQLTYNVTIGGTTPSYTIKSCVYNEAGTSKLIDVTSAAKTATGVVTVTVSPAVTLYPGNYYLFLGLASQSGTSPTLTFTTWTSTAFTWLNTSAIPAGKTKHEGTIASRTSGVCDANLFSPGVATNAITSTPAARLDN